MEREYLALLTERDLAQLAYKLIRDSFFFTDKRLVMIDRQGMTGNKVAYVSAPYRSIVRFAMETARNFDRDAELKIWVSGRPEPIELQFTRSVNIYEAQGGPRSLRHGLIPACREGLSTSTTTPSPTEAATSLTSSTL